METFIVVSCIFLYVLLEVLEIRERKQFERLKENNCGIFCPSCHNELFTNGETLHDGEILIKRCMKCDGISNWHLAIAPVPLLLNRPLKSHVDLYKEEAK